MSSAAGGTGSRPVALPAEAAGREVVARRAGGRGELAGAIVAVVRVGAARAQRESGGGDEEAEIRVQPSRRRRRGRLQRHEAGLHGRDRALHFLDEGVLLPLRRFGGGAEAALVELRRQILTRARGSAVAGTGGPGARRGPLVVLLLARDTAPPAEPAALGDRLGRPRLRRERRATIAPAMAMAVALSCVGWGWAGPGLPLTGRVHPCQTRGSRTAHGHGIF